MDAHQLQGLIAGIKGKLFEIRYVDYLNDRHLPDGFHAELAHSANNQKWDISIFGDDGTMHNAIQLKATESVSYVHHALERCPNIDVVITSGLTPILSCRGSGNMLSTVI